MNLLPTWYEGTSVHGEIYQWDVFIMMGSLKALVELGQTPSSPRQVA